jgi:hypothetical protein
MWFKTKATIYFFLRFKPHIIMNHISELVRRIRHAIGDKARIKRGQGIRDMITRALMQRTGNEPIKILDVGGRLPFWTESIGYQPDSRVEITILNLWHPDLPLPPHFERVIGDATDLSSFSDGQFDIVISNSVIGHVGGCEKQRQMAQEIQRVGKVYYVQTPNKYFLVDWRTLVPFFHLLPIKAQAWLVHHYSVGAQKRLRTMSEALVWAKETYFLSQREFVALFPSAIVKHEWILGMPTPKSLIVIGDGHHVLH